MDERRDHGLTEVRTAVDALDERIVALTGERQGRLERDRGEHAVRAPARVEAVVARVRSPATPAGAPPEVVERTYRALIGDDQEVSGA